MIENDDVAATVSKKLHDCYRLLEESIWEVNKHCSEEQAKAYRQKITGLFSVLVFELMEPLYEAHPKLKPSDWDI
jgi:hypothetical protein